jgi:hypothetical protein
VKLWIRCEKVLASGTIQAAYAKTELKVGGSVYSGSYAALTQNVFNDYYTLHDTNPNTGSAWKASEVNSMQIGVTLKGYYYVIPYPPPPKYVVTLAECTQVYAEVSYTPSTFGCII